MLPSTSRLSSTSRSSHDRHIASRFIASCLIVLRRIRFLCIAHSHIASHMTTRQTSQMLSTGKFSVCNISLKESTRVSGREESANFLCKHSALFALKGFRRFFRFVCFFYFTCWNQLPRHDREFAFHSDVDA